MYAKIVVLKIQPDTENGGAKSVVIGLFDEKGTLQLEIPRVSGKLFPPDIGTAKSLVFCKQNNVQLQLVKK
jgi:hypothetical protein